MDMKEIKMTKEELKQEAEEWLNKWELCNKCENKADCISNFSYCKKVVLQAYLASAEPKEKRITELEKENAELKEKLEGAEKARDYWKDSSFDWRHKCTSRKSFKVAVKAQKQLTKAKELIEDMYDKIPASHSDYYKDVMERAKQFLSEVEK
jgi:predicted aminopeptidase